MNTTEIEKPKCKITGENGNIFNLTALAVNALKRSGQRGTGSRNEAAR